MVMSCTLLGDDFQYFNLIKNIFFNNGIYNANIEYKRNGPKTPIKPVLKITTTATIVTVITLVIINQKFSARFARGYPKVSCPPILFLHIPEILAI